MFKRAHSKSLYLLVGGIIVIFSICGIPFGEAASPAPSSAPPAMPTPEAWLILPTLPADASQADYGAEAYRLVCQACHGDRGQGLTDEWRNSWAPADRNCWQSKCHAANHPPDGFDLPRWAPPIMGQGTLNPFATAADLQAFIKARMPWQQPGSLTDQEYWQITAFLLRANDLHDGSVPINATNAANLRLHPVASQTTQPAFGAWLLGLAALLVVVVVLAIVFLRRQDSVSVS